MNRKNILKGLILGLGVLALQSCDKDFNEVGNDVVGEPDFNIETYTVSDLITYNQATGPNSPSGVESSNLSEINLGVYDNPVFGKTSSSFVTAVKYSKLPDELGTNISVDSVYLYIPYFSEVEEYDDDSNPKYKLLHKYGTGTFDLKIHKSGYYLFAPNVGGNNDTKHYFSNDNQLIENTKDNFVLNNASKPNQNSNFLVSNAEIIIYKRDKDGNIIYEGEGDNRKPATIERLAPGLFTELDTQYFKQLIFDNPSQVADANSFYNHFRGLYFSVTESGINGTKIKLDLAKAKLVIRYSQDFKNKEGNTVRQNKVMEYGMDATVPKISFFKDTFNASYTEALTNADPVNGDEKLYLKGGNGSFAVLDLFNKDGQEELKKLKEEKPMINEAILTIYIDQAGMNYSESEPERLYLYNLDDQKVLLDFASDPQSSNNPNLFKTTFGGFIEKNKSEENKRGIRYRFKITDHIRNLIKQEGTYSPKLALISANAYDNSGIVSTYKKLKTEIVNTPSNIKAIPALEVEAQIGTLIYGANITGEKKMRLDIFYTKSKN